jgi:hypothetical protein
MLRRTLPSTILSIAVVCAWSCGGGQPPAPSTPPAQPAAPATPPATGVDDADPADDQVPVPRVRSAPELAALLPTNGTGCAPGARCIRVSLSGRPSGTGTAVAQCRGEMPDFIVPRNTIPASYSGPWFQPNLIEQAHTGVPQGTRPWRNLDPRVESQRLAYLLTLRNYAFASEPVRSLTPSLTADSDYFDPAGQTIPNNQRTQKWYPAPRMMFGNTNTPGSREAARGMTLERTVVVNELGGNTVAFRNYAVAYYDARGARTYARVWSTETPGRDTPRLQHMKVTNGGLVYKLLFSAARPTDFPQDLLAGSLALNILPNAGAPVNVRLLQIDIAVKDDRAGTTGWYFATYAYDRSIAGASPWLKMAPVGLMWGNDPSGPPIAESWINPGAPAYAKAHLGVDGRLNGPVDNRASACMSCHSTAQAPSVAPMVPPASGPCLPERSKWFRNNAGTTAFGRFDPEGSACETALNGITLTAADYSLQLGATVTRSMPPSAATFNPCTWDDANPPPPTPPSPGGAAPGAGIRIFEVTRDPKPQ